MWNLVAGAGLGALGGALKKNVPRYQQFDQMTDGGYRQDYSQDVMNYLRQMATGQQPLMSQAEINRQVSGSYGRLDADTAAARERIGERNLARQGSMGGMAEASMAELDRANLGQKRQLEAGIQNQLASQAPTMRMNAAGMGLNFLSDQERIALGEHQTAQANAAQRSQFSKWGNIIGGAISGMSAASGMGGMFGGGGQQMQQMPMQGGAMPSTALNFMPAAGASGWANASVPFNGGGGYDRMKAWQFG